MKAGPSGSGLHAYPVRFGRRSPNDGPAGDCFLPDVQRSRERSTSSLEAPTQQTLYKSIARSFLPVSSDCL
jgi:hypothetical protein